MAEELALSATKRTPDRIRALLALLIVAAGIVALQQAFYDSPTHDEPTYQAAGLLALTRDNLLMNPQHPPLAKIVADLPLLAVGPPIPVAPRLETPAENRYTAVYDREVIQRGLLHEVTVVSRLVPIAEFLLTIGFVFALARRLGGPWGGLLSAGLWAIDPFVLGFGHLLSIDLAFATATLAALLALWRQLERPSWQRLLVLGVAGGVDVLVRDTGPIVVACIALALLASGGFRPLRPTGELVRRLLPRVRDAVVMIVISLVMVWLLYLALDPAYTVHHPGLLPQRYIDGIRELKRLDDQPGPGFLFGHHWNGGRWWFWPGSALLKLPYPLLAAMVIAPLLWFRLSGPLARRALLVLAPTAVIITATTLPTPSDLGLRYLLVVVALLCVGCAPLALVRGRLAVGALGALIAVELAVVGLAFPDQFTWTNPPFRPGYTQAADANFDWGQSFYRLQSWSKGKNPWIRYDGPAGFDASEIPGARALAAHATPSHIHGWVAISASSLTRDRDDRWLLHHHIVGTLDGTILLFHLSTPARLGG